MKRLLAATLLGFAIMLGGCAGEYAEVPLAHVGKIKTKDGLTPGLVNPSQFRLPVCFWYCDQLLLAETSDFQTIEVFRDKNALYMPKSDLVMPFDVRGTFAVARDDERIERVFANLPTKPTEYSGASGIISANQIYDTYATPIIRDVVRSVVAKYSIDDVSSNRERVNQELVVALNSAFKTGKIPLDIRRFGLADVRYPQLVLEQKENAVRRKIDIEKEESEKQIRLVKLQADFEASKAERAIRRERAAAAKEENEIFSASVNEKYLAYKDREIMFELAKNPNTVWVPSQLLGNLGVQNAMFRDGVPKPATPAKTPDK